MRLFLIVQTLKIAKNTQDEFLDEILEITKENFISDNDFNHIQRKLS